MKLKYRIAGLIDDRGLTIKQFAKLAKFREHTLYDFMHDNRRLRIDEVVKIADALDVSIGELMEGVEV